MFTWICPQCGQEVPPHLSDCPNCAGKGQQQVGQAAPAASVAPPQPPVAPQQVYVAPALAPPVPPPVQGYVIPDPHQHGPRGWLVAPLVALVLVALGYGGYKLLLPSSRAAAPNVQDSAKTKFEVPQTGLAKAHPLGKYVEVTGLRVTEDSKQKLQIKLVVVNHSGAEMGDLKLQVRLKPVTAKPDAPSVAEFTVDIKTLGAFEATDVNATAKTNLRAYEFPDWQFLRAEFEITSP